MIPTVFVNADLHMIVNWKFAGAGGFPDELIPEYASYELLEGYCNVLTVMRDFYDDHFSFGLGLDAKSFRRIAENRLYLSGDSLGAAWLLGALCRFFSRLFPAGVLAWGALKPIRNGGFALFETGGTEMKIKCAEENGFSRIIVHRDEIVSGFNGETICLSGEIPRDLKTLEAVIHGRPEHSKGHF